MSGMDDNNFLHRDSANESQNTPHLEGCNGDFPTEIQRVEQFYHTDYTTQEHAKEAVVSTAGKELGEEGGEAAGFAVHKEIKDEAYEEVQEAGLHGEGVNWPTQEQPIEIGLSPKNAGTGEERADDSQGAGEIRRGGAHPKESDDHERRSHGSCRWQTTRPSGEPGREGSYSHPSQPRQRENWMNHNSTSENASPFASLYRSRSSAHIHGRTASAQFEWTPQRLRYAAAVAAPRYHSARRAGSVNRFTGFPENYSRHVPLSDREIDAIDRMAMHDARRQQAYERAQDLELMRESYVVSAELNKEKASYERWLELHERQEKLRYERQTQEAERLKKNEKRRAELAYQKERLVQERLQRMEANARCSYGGSSCRLPSTYLSQNTSMHDLSIKRPFIEQQPTSLNNRKRYNENGWEGPSEESAIRGSNTNGGLSVAASKRSVSGCISRRGNTRASGAEADGERIRVSTAVSHVRAWR